MPSGPPLRGNAPVEQLTALLDTVSASGASVLLTGQTGAGKSSLLSWVGHQARLRGFSVLSTVGVEASIPLPYLGLQQLVRPVVSKHAPLLPTAQRGALATALALGAAGRAEPILTWLAALHLISSVAHEQSVAVLIDDVEWLDPQTVDFVTFLARRQPVQGILLALTVGADQASPFEDVVSPVITVERGESEARQHVRPS
jgi:hypothetical protein